MNNLVVTTQPNRQGPLQLTIEEELVPYRSSFFCGGLVGAGVSIIAVGGVAKTLGLSPGASYGFVCLGGLAGAICFTCLAAIYNKSYINRQRPESTDIQAPWGDIPITADNLHLPSTQVITQQPGELPPLPTPPAQRNTVHLPGTEFDPPPSYSEVVQMGDIYPPPPPYSEVIEQPAME